MTAASLRMGVLRVAGVLGAVLFTAFFALTFSTPQWVERFAVDYIESRVSELVSSGIENLQIEPGDSAVSRVAEQLLRRNEHAIEQLKEDLRAGVQKQWAAALAEVQDPDCYCRNAIARVLEWGALVQLQSLEAVQERLVDFIQASYMDVATQLKRDLRIFAATNASVFLLLLLISFLRPQAARQLFLPGVLLSVAALLCAYLYVFEQNWLLTIIDGDYLGFAYAAYLCLAFLLLFDIAMNRARITTKIANSIIEILGGTLWLPC